MPRSRRRVTIEENFVGYLDDIFREISLDDRVQRLLGFLEKGDILELTGDPSARADIGVQVSTLQKMLDAGLTVDRARALLWPKTRSTIDEWYRIGTEREYARGVTKHLHNVKVNRPDE
jgi:hypothetical protein